jgi:hypothetical protein
MKEVSSLQYSRRFVFLYLLTLQFCLFYVNIYADIAQMIEQELELYDLQRSVGELKRQNIALKLAKKLK